MANPPKPFPPPTSPLLPLKKRMSTNESLSSFLRLGGAGKAVGLSEAAVRQRVSKLLETGVMQIVAVTDPLQVGFNREAMIGIEVDGDMEAVADVLSLMDEISYIILTAGSFDIILEVVCEDDEALLEVINRKIRAIPGVRRTETFMYLKLRKQSYTWGTR